MSFVTSRPSVGFPNKSPCTYLILHSIAKSNFSLESTPNTIKLILFNIQNVDNSFNPYEKLEREIHIISLKPQEQKFVETLLHIMETEYYRNGQRENSYIKLTLLQLLLFLNTCSPSQADEALEKINTTQKTIFEIIGYINNNYAEEISLEKISEQYFLSTYYFSRTFKEITGFHFIEYMNNVRIKEAKKLLLDTNLTVNEIATFVGFKSSTHFGRVFKQIEGVSPSLYKKKA